MAVESFAGAALIEIKPRRRKALIARRSGRRPLWAQDNNEFSGFDSVKSRIGRRAGFGRQRGHPVSESGHPVLDPHGYG